jgi:hypothetical protein
LDEVGQGPSQRDLAVKTVLLLRECSSTAGIAIYATKN